MLLSWRAGATGGEEVPGISGRGGGRLRGNGAASGAQCRRLPGVGGAFRAGGAFQVGGAFPGVGGTFRVGRRRLPAPRPARS